MQITAELHCHTRFSDGWSLPEACVRQAARRGIQVIAITDHNTAEGALQYWTNPIQHGVLVIPAEEITTEYGHVLAFFVRRTIPPGPYHQVIDAIHAQGALPFMAHPVHIPLGNTVRRQSTCKLEPEHLKRLAGLEVENGHNRPQANIQAARLAAVHGLPAIAGSDAHFPWEIGNASTEIELASLTHESVYAALQAGHTKPIPRRFNAYGIYLAIGLLNRLTGRQYAYKTPAKGALADIR